MSALQESEFESLIALKFNCAQRKQKKQKMQKRRTWTLNMALNTTRLESQQGLHFSNNNRQKKSTAEMKSLQHGGTSEHQSFERQQSYDPTPRHPHCRSALRQSKTGLLRDESASPTEKQRRTRENNKNANENVWQR